MYRFVYVSSALTAVFGVLCIYPLGIYGAVPIAFFAYSIFNLCNIAIFKKRGNLKSAAICSGVISLLVTIAIILYSGGIESPFIFILGVIVLGGYAGARIFGTIYLNAVILIIILIYGIGEVRFSFITNEVPAESEPHFSLISLIFAVYLVGGVFGETLLRAHEALSRSKSEIELRIMEKEFLLREVHHRVKNNLQTVSSLLNLQAKNTSNEKIRKLIGSSQNRVISMAMIHEMLYIRNDLSKIEFRPYVQELSDYLLNSADCKNKNIRIQLHIPEIKLCIDTAIPLGLLINEAVTNSLKYGFTNSANGQIDITLKKEDAVNAYVLGIKDDGIGFSEELDFRTTKSLGLKLIHNLARQLRGSVQRKSCSKGTDYQIAFLDVDRQLSPVN
ncbi:sensor histidine kinase [Pricia sp.]|uniref:sensor histidine kinase n=1 Tax=Pricia sp. TaxID=2268138 RepID=UPI0035934C03